MRQVAPSDPSAHWYSCETPFLGRWLHLEVEPLVRLPKATFENHLTLVGLPRARLIRYHLRANGLPTRRWVPVKRGRPP